MNKRFLVKSLIIIVVIVIALWSIIWELNTTQTMLAVSPILVERIFTSDTFEARVLCPKDVRPGQEITIKIYAEAKNDYVLSGVVVRAYSHALPIIVLEEKGNVIYENSTRFSPPVRKFSKVYRIKLSENIEGLGLSICITSIKLGNPVQVHFSKPIIINIEVKDVTPKTQIRTSTLPLITTSIKLPPKPWSNLSISTDKEVYEVGECVRIILTNKGDKIVRIKPNTPWVICLYNPEENRISYFCIYEPPRNDKWIVLSPGSSIVWVWNQTSTWGSPVEPGHYIIVLGRNIVIEVNGEHISVLGMVEDVNAKFTIVKNK